MSVGRTATRLLTPAALALVCTLAARPAAAPDTAEGTETRALWVLRTSLTSQASIEALVKRARDNGFNALFVQVRGRGDAYYRGGLEPIPSDLQRQPPSFDPPPSGPQRPLAECKALWDGMQRKVQRFDASHSACKSDADCATASSSVTISWNSSLISRVRGKGWPVALR